MKLINSDCIAAMKEMPDNSVDSVVTDPPYELGFMGKSWDSSGIAFNVEVWQEALRVLKPGGHLIAFSGSRTYHRMAVAIEDAGFQIRDQIMWIYGSGFPKSLDISKAIDKAAGEERKVIGEKITGRALGGSNWKDGDAGGQEMVSITAPATQEAQTWAGWGTALKPAHEPIVVARKPIEGTVAANVLTYGTSGLNIDGARVATTDSFGGGAKGTSGFAAGYEHDGWVQGSDAGRWPANVIHDGSDEVVEYFGEPQRFFYCAKANKKDRNDGLDDFDAIRVHDGRKAGNPGGSNPRNRTNDAKVNHHPTVKPTDLMRYLCRLITPPNGVVLDPFMGSGSTGKGAILEGFDFIGIEQDADYMKIAQARIEFAINKSSETLF